MCLSAVLLVDKNCARFSEDVGTQGTCGIQQGSGLVLPSGPKKANSITPWKIRRGVMVRISKFDQQLSHSLCSCGHHAVVVIPTSDLSTSAVRALITGLVLH